MYYFCSANEETNENDWVTFLTETDISDEYPYFKKWARPISELKEYISQHPNCRIYKKDADKFFSEKEYKKYIENLSVWIET